MNYNTSMGHFNLESFMKLQPLFGILAALIVVTLGLEIGLSEKASILRWFGLATYIKLVAARPEGWTQPVYRRALGIINCDWETDEHRPGFPRGISDLHIRDLECGWVLETTSEATTRQRSCHDLSD